MKLFQPTPGDNNARMNVGCMTLFILFELIMLAVLVALMINYRVQHPFPKEF